MAALLRRYLAGQIRTDLERKMVFVSGPRQVGKTTRARGLLPDATGYLSWDIPDHRDAILRGRLPNAPMLVFDELHKFRGWRGFLKGLYDRRDGTRILVTGSGRLDSTATAATPCRGATTCCACTRCRSPSSASPTTPGCTGSSTSAASPSPGWATPVMRPPASRTPQRPRSARPEPTTTGPRKAFACSRRFPSCGTSCEAAGPHEPSVRAVLGARSDAAAHLPPTWFSVRSLQLLSLRPRSPACRKATPHQASVCGGENPPSRGNVACNRSGKSNDWIHPDSGNGNRAERDNRLRRQPLH